MGDLTANLSRHEFDCECGCGFDTVDVELAYALQDVTDEFKRRYPMDDVRLYISGPNRCVGHNRRVGGSENSQHTLGRAADFYLTASYRPIPDDDVADYLEQKYPGKWGVGRYVGRTHLDTRTNGPARWYRR